MPCVLLGLFDKEHEKKHLIKHSYLYSFGRVGRYYNKSVFWRTIFFGWYTGFVITMGSLLLNENYPNSTFKDTGRVAGLYTSDKLMLYSLFLIGWLNVHSSSYKIWIFWVMLVLFGLTMEVRTIIRKIIEKATNDPFRYEDTT